MPDLMALTAKHGQHLGTQDTVTTLHKVKVKAKAAVREVSTCKKQRVCGIYGSLIPHCLNN